MKSALFAKALTLTAALAIALTPGCRRKAKEPITPIPGARTGDASGRIGNPPPGIGGGSDSVRPLTPGGTLGDGSDATAMSATGYLPNAVPMELSLSVIPNPSEVIVIQETIRLVSYTALRPAVAADFGSCPGEYTYWHVKLKPGTDWYSDIHAKGGNFVFTDGHAQYKKAKQLRARDFGLTDGTTGKENDDNTAADQACYKSPFAKP